jgi:hypothetical protein
MSTRSYTTNQQAPYRHGPRRSGGGSPWFRIWCAYARQWPKAGTPFPGRRPFCTGKAVPHVARFCRVLHYNVP